MTQHKRLGIDIDGVLADFTSAYEQRIVEVTGRDLFQPKPFVPSCWHYPEKLGYTSIEMRAVLTSIAEDHEFWWKLQPCEGGREAYLKLASWPKMFAHDVYFLTSRVGKDAKTQTEEWLLNFGPESLPTILITRNKPYAVLALELDIFIDDYHQNTRELALAVPACRTYLLNRPWNANEFAGIDVVRVDTLEEMFQRESL